MIFQNIKEKINPTRVTTWYEKYERKIASFFLVGGFIVDWMTLQRVDTLWENIWIIGHIVMIGTFIVLVHRYDEAVPGDGQINLVSFWFTNILQFFFGGILSVFLVFYFRSAELSTSWLFIMMLLLIFWANESLKQHLARLTFQLSLYFFVLFCSFIFLVPVVVHKIGAWIFILSGLLSLLCMILFLHIFVRFTKEKFYASRKSATASVLGIFVLMNVFYFTNLIPPIPLSLKDSGIYHSVQRGSNDSYTAKYEDFGWRSFLQIYKSHHYVVGSEVYAYSAIFSPTSLNINVIHEWQKYDDENKEWVDYGRLNLPVVGGRDNGFRTYSIKTGLTPGLWRVNVKTTGGQVIGRLRFEVIPVTSMPTLKTKTLE